MKKFNPHLYAQTPSGKAHANIKALFQSETVKQKIASARKRSVARHTDRKMQKQKRVAFVKEVRSYHGGVLPKGFKP